MADETLPKEIQAQLKKLEKLEKAQKRRQAQQNEAAKRQYRKKKTAGYKRVVLYVDDLSYRAMRKLGYRPYSLLWTTEDLFNMMVSKHEANVCQKKSDGTLTFILKKEDEIKQILGIGK